MRPMGLDRRSFLKLAAATGAGAAAAPVLEGAAFAAALGVDPEGVFQYGVASGDPLPSALLIWTRVTPTATATPGSGRGPSVTVRWEVATDAAFTKVVRRSIHLTPFGEDFCRAVLLEPDDDADYPSHQVPDEAGDG